MSNRNSKNKKNKNTNNSSGCVRSRASPAPAGVDKSSVAYLSTLYNDLSNVVRSNLVDRVPAYNHFQMTIFSHKNRVFLLYEYFLS